MLHEKSQSVDTLEVFVNEVERQLDKNVKLSGLTDLVNTMEYMMKVDSALVHLLSSYKAVVFVLNTLCQEHHNKMV